MKRIIRNISLCVLLALVMGACEEDAALVAPNVAYSITGGSWGSCFPAKCFRIGK